MKKHHIATIEVTTKKNTSQLTRWIVTREPIYPSIHMQYSSLRWQDENLLSNKEAPKLPYRFDCFLLRSDVDPENYEFKGTRVDHAGFEQGYTYDPETGMRVPIDPNPGCIIYRGASLGEMRVTFKSYTYDALCADMEVRGIGNSAHGAERAFIKEQIVPKLQEFILANDKALYDHAVERTKARATEAIEKAKKELADAEAKMMAVLAKL
jgi:hypothetical protein